MALRNWLLLSQIAGYLVGLILCICIVVPMSMHQYEFNGHCLLFSDAKPALNDIVELQRIDWASRGYCSYVIVVGVFMSITCFTQIYRLLKFVCRGTDSSFLSAFLEAIGCSIICLLGISTAVIVTVGFTKWCQSITRTFPSCEAAAGQKIDKKDEIITTGFYFEIGTVQFATWAAFATWVGLAVLSTLKVVHFHQLENIQVSMYRERQRLLTESGLPATHRERSRITTQRNLNERTPLLSTNSDD